MPAEELTRFRTERFTAFADAVVAIAMTLLILPLMESVSEAAKADLSTAAFLQEHQAQLFTFALSFLLIASFWLNHHRLYARVELVTRPLLWLNVFWLVTIVWLPVPTAMLGQLPPDALQVVIYIGTLGMTHVASIGARIYLLRHPELLAESEDWLRAGVMNDVASILLFAIAIVVAIAIGPYGYFSLLLLFLTTPVSRLLARLFRVRISG